MISTSTREELGARVRPALHEAYRKFRGRHQAAYGLNAFKFAKAQVDDPRPKLEWHDVSARVKAYGEHVLQQAEWDEGPFHFVAQFIPDYDRGLLDDEDFCTFTQVSQYSPAGAAEAGAARPDREAVWVKGGRGDTRGWFQSGYSYEERREALSATGYSRQVAHEMARAGIRESAKHLERWLNDEWQFVTVTVYAVVGGVTLERENVGYVAYEWRDYEDVDEAARELAGQVETAALKQVEGAIDGALARLKEAVAARSTLMGGEDRHGAVLAQGVAASIELREVWKMVNEPKRVTRATLTLNDINHIHTVETEQI